jgi:hypothetical protein
MNSTGKVEVIYGIDETNGKDRDVISFSIKQGDAIVFIGSFDNFILPESYKLVKKYIQENGKEKKEFEVKYKPIDLKKMLETTESIYREEWIRACAYGYPTNLIKQIEIRNRMEDDYQTTAKWRKALEVIVKKQVSIHWFGANKGILIPAQNKQLRKDEIKLLRELLFNLKEK